MTLRRLRPVLLAGLVLAVPSLGQAQRYDPRQVDPRGGGQGDPYRERVEVRLNALESEFSDITGRVEETGYNVRRLQRSEERRVGTEGVSSVRSRWSPYH